MKKLAAYVLAIMLIALSAFALATDGGSESGAYWYFGVPMYSLYTEYNKLVNREMLLDADYEPDDLVKISVKKASSSTIMMRKAASDALERMFAAALEDGYTLVAKSGYRSYGTQKTMYNNRLEANGGKDDGVVAYPGSSDHQTGLACDVLNTDYAARPRMTTDFGLTGEAQWMAENCADFGFIIRYPEGKQDITGIIYEPWHLRYVGPGVSSFIMGRGLTFEEFTDMWQVAVAEFEGAGGDVEAQIKMEEERRDAPPEAITLEKTGEDGDAEVSISF